MKILLPLLLLLVAGGADAQTATLKSARATTAITVTSQSFEVGFDVTSPGGPRDYVGLFALDGSGVWQWKYMDNTNDVLRHHAATSGPKSGTVTFTAKPGKYELRIYPDGAVITTVPLKVLPVELFTNFDTMYSTDQPITAVRKPAGANDTIEVTHKDGSKETITLDKNAVARAVAVTVISATPIVTVP